MRVALVGHPNTIERIRKMMDPETLFMEVEEFPCSWDTVVSILEKVQLSFDVVLFTGVRYYMYACRYLTPAIPWGYPRRSVDSVLCTLLKAQINGAPLGRITFDMHDITSRQMKELLCDKVGLPVSGASFYRYNDTPYYQAYLVSTEPAANYNRTACAYHLDNLKNGRADLCLSASIGVAEDILLKDYPVFLVPLTERDVNHALNDLRIQHELRNRMHEQNMTPAVVAVSVRMEEKYSDSVREVRQLYTDHQIEIDVISYAQSIGAAAEKQTNGSFLLYTTQQELLVTTEHLAKFDLPQKLQYLPDVASVALGVGFGQTYSMAKNNAQHSLRCAGNQKHSCYYITSEAGKPTGPFVLKQIKSEQAFADVQTERISCETGTTTAVINRLIKAQKQYGVKTFTSDKLAESCGLTLSSMNRVVAKLVQSGYAEIVGSRPQNGAGRPKRLIRLKLPVI